MESVALKVISQPGLFVKQVVKYALYKTPHTQRMKTLVNFKYL